MVMPLLPAAHRNQRSLGGKLFAPFPAPCGQIVARRDLRSGVTFRHRGTTRRRERTSGLHAVNFRRMIAHRFHGFAAPLQRLTHHLGVLQLHRVDFRRVEGPGQLTQLVGGFVFAPLHLLGHHVETVDHPPGNLSGEFFHPGIAQHVEDCSHRQFDRGPHLVRIGHFHRGRLVHDRHLGQLARLDEACLVAQGQFLVHRSPLAPVVHQMPSKVGKV